MTEDSDGNLWGTKNALLKCGMVKQVLLLSNFDKKFERGK